MLFGTIEGEYEFDPDSEHGLLSHTRKVQWVRNDITYGMYNKTFELSGLTPPHPPTPVWSAGQYAEQIQRLLEHGDMDDPDYIDDDDVESL